MIQAIMNIVEWVLVWCVGSIIVVPFIIHVIKPTAIGECGQGLGDVYFDIAYSCSHHYPAETAGIVAILFFVAAAFPMVAAALCIWAFQITVLIYQSIKRGYHPTVG
ncbi:hypothetical protein D9M68_20260 [compost metagenome]